MTIKEQEKGYIANKYGEGVLTYEVCNAFSIACLLYQEQRENICRVEVFDWCYTNLGWGSPKKAITFQSNPSGATVLVTKK